MNFWVIALGIFFVVLSTSIISYISMATMVGPWIAPTLVLMASLILRLRRTNSNENKLTQELGLIQSVGSVGGAVGMAFGFALPTLYFLDPKIFKSFISEPIYFSFLLGFLCLASGGLGILLARLLNYKILEEKKMPFPVSSLIFSVITSQAQQKQAKNMFFGLFLTTIFCFIRDGFLWFVGLLPRIFYIFPSVFGRELSLPIFLGPSYLAIGFTSGTLIAFPLFIGIMTRYLVINPLNYHSKFLPWTFFEVLNIQEFTLAFCSGLVFSELAWGLRSYPIIFLKKLYLFFINFSFKKGSKLINKKQPGELNLSFMQNKGVNFKLNIFELSFVGFLAFGFLTYARFPFLSQVFMLTSLIIATYQVCVIGAKSGLVPFARFATFIMVPSMMFFHLDYLQLTLLCVFVNVCVCVASDLLFDYKVGELCKIDNAKIHRYQWLGLIISSLCVGFILWLFFNNFELGSAELCAQRGQSRALLIQMTNFNYTVLALGFIYGLLVIYFRVSSALLMGGILMPNSISIGLIIGGFLSKLFTQPEKTTPFWSGVFAGECLWILICVFAKFLFKV